MQKNEQGFNSLLHQIDTLNVNISVQDGNLHISAPKGVITSKLREQLTRWKEELIYHFQEPTISLDSKGANLPASRGSQELTLSYAQEGVWFLEKLNPGSATYHIPFGVDFFGEVRPEIMIEAIRWLMNRPGDGIPCIAAMSRGWYSLYCSRVPLMVLPVLQPCPGDGTS
ncbi:MAG: hypothetical protein AAGD96_12350, partial [Chloroflexota bacterium]